MTYLVKPNEGQSKNIVDDDVLHLAVLAELGIEVSLLDGLADPADPDALGWRGTGESQLHDPWRRVAEDLAVAIPNGLADATDIGILNAGVAGLGLDVNVQNLAKWGELVMNFRIAC